MNLELICKAVQEAAREAGAFMLNEQKLFNLNKVEVKSFNQLVSYVDKTSEIMLVDNLKALLPEAGFLTEENTITTSQKELTWVIDPLDGTTNFVHGLPVYSVSIGLLKGGEPILGVVYEVNRDEMFYAWQNGGCWLNGRQVFVKENNDLGKSLLATGFPYYDFSGMDAYLNTLRYFMANTQGMRRMGSAAVDLAYTACGRFDGFFEYGLSPWDVAAGVCLVKEAGGVVTEFNGGNNSIFGKTIAGASKNLYDKFIGVIQEQNLHVR